MRAPWDEPNALPDDALKNREGRQGRRMTDSGSQRYFDDPIQLPTGECWSNCMTRQPTSGLPKKDAAEPEWQAAIEALVLVVERPDDVCPDRRHESIEPAPRSGV
jgi:hypothetical protein